MDKTLRVNHYQNTSQLFKNMKVGRFFQGQLAHMECIYGMKAGQLRAEVYGHYTLDDSLTKVQHVKTDKFLGLKGLCSNHASLIMHDVNMKCNKRGYREFFDKVFEYIHVKEFVEKLDNTYHRSKARKGINALKENWINRIHSKNQNSTKIKNLIDNEH